MPANKFYKFRRIEDVLNFLNGGIVGGSTNRSNAGGGVPAGNMNGIYGLVGKTLIFTSPAAATVTFVAASGAGGSAAPPGTNPDPNTLMFKDIAAQIAAALPTVKVTLTPDQQLCILETTPAMGVAIAAAGTANSLLGFDTSAATIGKLYPPAAVAGGATPCWTWSYSGNDNMHDIYTWE
ncbi:MAG: hypothetical protein ACYDAE_21370 [Steroidobacteraceae bacterium]